MDPEIRAEVDFALYRGSLLSSGAWMQKAEALLQAASLLETSVQAIWESRIRKSMDHSMLDPLPAGILGVHLMLVAYGIEITFKGLLVQIGSSEITEELERSGQLPRQLRTHSLTRLARLSGFEPTLEEEALLRRLTRAAYWSARYPIPVHVNDRSTREAFSDDVLRPVAYHWPGDIVNLKALVARIRQHLASVAA